MPRIRKKTSKRGTTAQRFRIKRKVVESRKKSKKAAKKDVTWKSKKAKDPGIPNNFPYKDQILAEIAEERRQAAEAKARRREEKKSLRAQQKVALKSNGKDDGDDGSSGEDNDDVEGENGDFDGVATLGGPLENSSKSTKNGIPHVASNRTAAASASTADASGAPLLLNSDLPHLSAVLDKADVVIEVLDARDPLAYRSSALEARVASKEGQKLLLVLNKIDTCPRETTAAWAAHLRSEHPTLLFRVASAFLPPPITHDPTKGKGKRKEPCNDAWGLDAVSKLLGVWAQEKTSDGPLHVAVVGLTNSGKSAFINSLARRAMLDIYAISSSTNGPSTTPHALEATLELDGRPIVFIDTPGIAWEPSEEVSSEESEGRRAQDVLLRNRGRIDRLKDPNPAISCIVSRAQTEDLMVFYGLPAFAKGDVDAFLVGVARAHGLIKKRGNPDLAVAARIVLRDWSTGKLSRYAIPPPTLDTETLPNNVPPTPVTIYAGDAELLEKITPRKELRLSRDLVRLSSSRVDDRSLMLEESWLGADDADDESNSDVGADENEGEDELDGGAEGEAEVEAIGSGTDEEENEVLPSVRSSSTGKKRKRPQSPLGPPKPQPNSARPRKKVTFSASVMAAPSSTQSRSPLLSKSKSKLKSVEQMERARPSVIKTSKMLLTRHPPAMAMHAPAGKQPPPSHVRASVITANTPSARKHRQGPGAGEDVTYDFSKFF